ncbi:HAD hydrolase-like protein [uncultured Sphingomonas sp.]|uniref:HAD hydrolase-like protein n=1 Tax=uncultured Sphingomonas sp. TaxID=158754 RepID=UPI0026044324|nr:HAD hydrolase-like protein [uncultured Sphingomonas sp.]
MNVFPFTIVGFDLDGTLLDTSADLAAAVNHALAVDGRAPVPADAVRAMIGGGARRMLAQALSVTGGCDAATLERLFPVLLDFYAANLVVDTAPFPGMIAALDALAALNVTLAVMTNKREDFARPILDALGLTSRFATIIGGDTLGVAKPSPVPIEEMIARCGGGRAAFVGDSSFDVDAAHAAGIPAVACAFGFLNQPVETLGAEAVIAHFDELVPALERL